MQSLRDAAWTPLIGLLMGGLGMVAVGFLGGDSLLAHVIAGIGGFFTVLGSFLIVAHFYLLRYDNRASQLDQIADAVIGQMRCYFVSIVNEVPVTLAAFFPRLSEQLISGYTLSIFRFILFNDFHVVSSSAGAVITEMFRLDLIRTETRRTSHIVSRHDPNANIISSGFREETLDDDHVVLTELGRRVLQLLLNS